MKGGELSCNRTEIGNNCITVSCVDYAREMYNSNTFTECINGWSKHWDTSAKGHYYYNKNTGVATWIPPEGFRGGKFKIKSTKSRKNKRTKKLKKRRTKKQMVIN